MLKILKFSSKNLFFWSDLHSGHDPIHWPDPIWNQRGFSSAKECDIALINRWNEKIDNESTVIHLGDILFGQDALNRIKNLVNQLKFKTLLLVPGNHLGGYKQWYAEIKQEQGYSDDVDVFPLKFNYNGREIVFLPNLVQCYVDKQAVILSHWPQRCWDGYAKGAWNLHGHNHGRFYPGLPETFNEGKYLDLSVENFPYPASFQEIKRIMDKKNIKVEDHHTEKTLNPFG